VANLISIPALLNRFRNSQMLDFMVRSIDGQWKPIQATKGRGLTGAQQRVYNMVELIETSESANKAFSDIARLHNSREELLTRRVADQVPSFQKLTPQQK